LLSLGRVRECLEDAELALKVGHAKREKLQLRIEKCQKQSLPWTADEKCPEIGLNEKVGIEKDALRGRFAKAKADIRVGEVILVEDALSAVAKSSDDRCFHCLKYC